MFLAAASQRTKNIRLGHGIIQTAPGYNHPARTAERVAMLDLVSNGRVEFGSGESSSEAELGGFGIDPFTKREQWREGLEVAIRCMTEAPFTGHDGQVRVDAAPQRRAQAGAEAAPAAVGGVLAPRHDPARRRAGHRRAHVRVHRPRGGRSTGCSDYETTLADKGVPVGKAVNPQVACVTPMMCAPNEDDAIRMGLEGGNFFGYSLAHYYVFGDHVPGATERVGGVPRAAGQDGLLPRGRRRRSSRSGSAPRSPPATTPGLRGAVGTPDQIREFLRRYEEAGVDQLIFVMQAGKNRHEDIMASLELFGREVLPEFAERDDAQAAGQGRRGSSRSSSRPWPARSTTRRRCPRATSMKALPKQMAEAAQNEQFEKWMQDFADKSAVGDREADLGILG